MAPAGWKARKPRSAHRQLDLAVADGDAAPQHQLGVDAPGAVGGARGGVDLPDDLCQPGVADLLRRGGRMIQA
jgi:hypothetical protein